MRLATALALSFVLGTSALAQTQYADSSGGFVVLNQLDLGASGRYGGQRVVDAAIGYRFAMGADVGVRAGLTSPRGALLGVAVGYTAPVGLGARARLEGSALTVRQQTLPDALGSGGTSVGYAFDVTATVSRPVHLIGSVRLTPTVGVFGAATSPVARSAFSALGRSANPLGPFVGGVHVELPLSFRLFGSTASVAPAVRFPIGDGFRFELPSERAYAGGGLRLNL